MFDSQGNFIFHGIEWKNHKYIRKEGNRYIYPEDIKTPQQASIKTPQQASRTPNGSGGTHGSRAGGGGGTHADRRYIAPTPPNPARATSTRNTKVASSGGSNPSRAGMPSNIGNRSLSRPASGEYTARTEVQKAYSKYPKDKITTKERVTDPSTGNYTEVEKNSAGRITNKKKGNVYRDNSTSGKFTAESEKRKGEQANKRKKHNQSNSAIASEQSKRGKAAVEEAIRKAKIKKKKK